LKIVGYDGTEISTMGNLSLSTVVQPIREIAFSTVDTLLGMFEDKADGLPNMHIKLPVTFVKRDTT
jgi:DNA-binding LacI/PurR family transcriptional regulator